MRLLPEPVIAAAAQPPIDTAPSRKFTVPVGLLPATVAVNVTATFTSEGLTELARVVVEGAGPPPAALTACDKAALVEVTLPASPL